MWMGRKRVDHSRRCRRGAMCLAEASCPQPSQGKSVGTAIYKMVEQGRGRGKCAKARLRQSAHGSGGCEAGMVRGKNAAQPHRWLVVNPLCKQTLRRWTEFASNED